MANFLKFWVPLFGRPYFFSLNEQGQAARAPSRARVGLLTQGVWPMGNEGARRNSQKRPKITLTALSEPFPAPCAQTCLSFNPLAGRPRSALHSVLYGPDTYLDIWGPKSGPQP